MSNARGKSVSTVSKRLLGPGAGRTRHALVHGVQNARRFRWRPEVLKKQRKRYEKNVQEQRKKEVWKGRLRPARVAVHSLPKVSPMVSRKRAASAPVNPPQRRRSAGIETEENHVMQFIEQNSGAYGSVDLEELRVWLKENRAVHGKLGTVTTAAHVQAWVKVTFDVELSKKKTKELINGLGFRWGPLKPGYYESHKKLEHVTLHRQAYLPWAQVFFSLPDLFVVVSLDMSFVHGLTVNRSGYIDMTDMHGDSDRAERTTGGPTVGYALAVTRDGVLCDENNKPVVTTVDHRAAKARRKGAIPSFDAAAALDFVRRVCDAVKYRYPHHLAVIQLDNNSAHTTMPSDAIAPSSINMKSVSKKIGAMRIIGTVGLRDLLQRLGRWRAGMPVAEARNELWNWDVVVDQRTVLEEEVRLTANKKQFLIYNVKYHPEYQPVEKLWRYCKVPLRQNRFDDINAVRPQLLCVDGPCLSNIA
jgi:hypothetical protein